MLVTVTGWQVTSDIPGEPGAVGGERGEAGVRDEDALVQVQPGKSQAAFRQSLGEIKSVH